MKKLSFILLASIFLTGCVGIAVPPEKADYVGVWKSDSGSISLIIYETGRIEYEKKGPVNTSISAPLLSFENEDFTSGLGFMKKTFDVTKAPYKKDGVWHLELDSVTLTKQ